MESPKQSAKIICIMPKNIMLTFDTAPNKFCETIPPAPVQLGKLPNHGNTKFATPIAKFRKIIKKQIVMCE